MSIANGTAAPGIVITKKNGSVVTVPLPSSLPEENAEDPGPVEIKHSGFDFEDLVDRIGYKPKFTISYETVIDGYDLLQLRYLLENQAAKIVLTPHVDLPGRSFEVSLTSFGELKRVGESWGHSGVKMVFLSTKVLDAIPFPELIDQ